MLVFQNAVEEVLFLGRRGVHCGGLSPTALAVHLGKVSGQPGQDPSWHQGRTASGCSGQWVVLHVRVLFLLCQWVVLHVRRFLIFSFLSVCYYTCRCVILSVGDYKCQCVFIRASVLSCQCDIMLVCYSTCVCVFLFLPKNSSSIVCVCVCVCVCEHVCMCV